MGDVFLIITIIATVLSGLVSGFGAVAASERTGNGLQFKWGTVGFIACVGAIIGLVLTLGALSFVFDDSSETTTPSPIETAVVAQPTMVQTAPTNTPQILPTTTSEPIVPAATATTMVVAAATPSFSGLPVTTIEVVGADEDGTDPWCTSVSGEHLVVYQRGAYSPFPTDAGCDPKGCWKGTVFGYKNSTLDIIFAGSTNGEPQSPDLRLGWDDWFLTYEIAEAQSQTLEPKTIDLQAGECLTFIAIDGRDAYHSPTSNRGEVFLDIYLPTTAMTNSTLCTAIVTREEVESWYQGEVGVDIVSTYLDLFAAKRPTDIVGVFSAGMVVPAGSVVATDYGGAGLDWRNFNVRPLVHSGSWGLFEVLEAYTAPFDGACLAIKE